VTEDRFPKQIGSLIGHLMARRGYAQVFASDALQAVLEAEVGVALASSVRAGKVRAGVLQIFASDSVTLQELTFRKRSILKRIQENLPENKINDLRFRIQST
jgi:predicted nucleic acid-binding Zn ribbon protein